MRAGRPYPAVQPRQRRSSAAGAPSTRRPGAAAARRPPGQAGRPARVPRPLIPVVLAALRQVADQFHGGEILPGSGQRSPPQFRRPPAQRGDRAPAGQHVVTADRAERRQPRGGPDHRPLVRHPAVRHRSTPNSSYRSRASARTACTSAWPVGTCSSWSTPSNASTSPAASSCSSGSSATSAAEQALSPASQADRTSESAGGQQASAGPALTVPSSTRSSPAASARHHGR